MIEKPSEHMRNIAVTVRNYDDWSVEYDISKFKFDRYETIFANEYVASVVDFFIDFHELC